MLQESVKSSYLQTLLRRAKSVHLQERSLAAYGRSKMCSLFICEVSTFEGGIIRGTTAITVVYCSKPIIFIFKYKHIIGRNYLKIKMIDLELLLV